MLQQQQSKFLMTIIIPAHFILKMLNAIKILLADCVFLGPQRSAKILLVFVGPCFLAESGYQIWWYASGYSQIPFLGNVYLSDVVACILELCSWLYRTTVIFLVCVLFRLICHLQILRLRDFANYFHVDSDVESVLSEHLRIRRHLRIISHRFRAFILLALVMVTGSQFACLLVITQHSGDANIYRTGELAVCSSFSTFLLSLSEF